MRRRLSAVLWLGISLVCSAAGCSGDRVSSAVAVRSQNDDRIELTGITFDAANADPPQAFEAAGLAFAAGEVAAVEKTTRTEVFTTGEDAELPADRSEFPGC